MWRNKRHVLIDRLNRDHEGMCKIYNLCAEDDMQYSSSEVSDMPIGRFPFRDHNVCSISRMVQFCLDCALFLQRMEQIRVQSNSQMTPAIVVHCKAGKGRTGMMISAILLFVGMFRSAEEAYGHYNATRVSNNKGLTIASQKRYVKFMEGFLNYELNINQKLPEY